VEAAVSPVGVGDDPIPAHPVIRSRPAQRAINAILFILYLPTGYWYYAAFRSGVIAASPQGEEATSGGVHGGDCFVALAPGSDRSKTFHS
jgi:hypothetical protein